MNRFFSFIFLVAIRRNLKDKIGHYTIIYNFNIKIKRLSTFFVKKYSI